MCKQMLIDWKTLADTKSQVKADLKDRIHLFWKKRYVRRLKSARDLSKARTCIVEKIHESRRQRLLMKSIDGFFAYLDSRSCILNRKARRFRHHSLKTTAVKAFKAFRNLKGKAKQLESKCQTNLKA